MRKLALQVQGRLGREPHRSLEAVKGLLWGCARTPHACAAARCGVGGATHAHIRDVSRCLMLGAACQVQAGVCAMMLATLRFQLSGSNVTSVVVMSDGLSISMDGQRGDEP